MWRQSSSTYLNCAVQLDECLAYTIGKRQFKFYNIMAILILLYGCKTWVIRSKVEVAEITFKIHKGDHIKN